MPPLCRDTQSLGQKMLKEPLSINGINSARFCKVVNIAEFILLYIILYFKIYNLYYITIITMPGSLTGDVGRMERVHQHGIDYCSRHMAWYRVVCSRLFSQFRWNKTALPVLKNYL